MGPNFSEIFSSNENKFDSALLDSAESALNKTVWSPLFHEYLRKSEIIWETILVCQSGDYVGFIHEIKMSTYFVTLPL